MAGNSYKNLAQAKTVTLATNMTNAFATSPVAYGLTTSQVTALSNALTDYTDAIAEADTAVTTAHAAIQGKASRKGSLGDEMAALAKTVYANPSVTDAQLASAGLQPRPGRSHPAPVIPSDFVVTTSAPNKVDLKWKANGNLSGTTYAIEGSSDGAEWSIVKLQSAKTASLSGYAPGVTYWFRVRASRAGELSDPTSEIPIYPTGSGSVVTLKAA